MKIWIAAAALVLSACLSAKETWQEVNGKPFGFIDFNEDVTDLQNKINNDYFHQMLAVELRQERDSLLILILTMIMDLFRNVTTFLGRWAEQSKVDRDWGSNIHGKFLSQLLSCLQKLFRDLEGFDVKKLFEDLKDCGQDFKDLAEEFLEAWRTMIRSTGISEISNLFLSNIGILVSLFAQLSSDIANIVRFVRTPPPVVTTIPIPTNTTDVSA